MFEVIFLISGIISFLICVIVIPFLIKLSIKKHWYDEIDDRKIHTGKISRLAGIAIFWSMFFSTTIIIVFVCVFTSFKIDIPLLKIATFLFAAILVHLVGLLDDFKNIRPRYKFLVQLFAVCIVVFSGNTYSNIFIPFANVYVNIGPAGYLISAVWIIGACNAVNLIDGVDGLSGGITAIAALVISISALFLGYFTTAIVSFALFGSIIGFLVFNFPPAKIFMGDSGSLFLGLLISILPLLEMNISGNPVLIIAISVLFVPVIDTLTSMLRRIQRKQSPFYPDREHIHHKLLDRNFSTKKVLFTLYAVSILLGLCIILWATTKNSLFININVCFWLVFIIISLFLEKHNSKKTPSKNNGV